ncbi:MAG: hypothetical protein GY805_08015, partial [Chloroflexi bacterium]|nr:hypothetical protein [Chloroflexota bacterium]
ALALPNILQLLAFLLIYTFVMGPLNYWFLKRRNQLERAWITIPVLVIIFSGVTYFTGFQLRGNDTIINQISVAYSQMGGEKADVYSLLGLYSPQRNTYDLILPAGTLARPYSQDYGSPFNNNAPNIEAISYGNEVIISDVRVDIGDVSVFMAQTAVPAIDVSGTATLTLEGDKLALQLDLLNNSDVTLETASVLLGNTAVAMGDIGAGERTAVSQAIGSRSSSASTSPFGGPSYGAPLSANAETILGSPNFYDDRALFPRWQLLQSLESSNFGGSNTFTIPKETVILIAWSNEEQIDASLDDAPSDNQSTTLYLIEIPLQQNFVSGRNVAIPLSLLDWEALANSQVYDPTIQGLYLNGGWVEFSYTPWPEFQNMDVTELGFSLTQLYEDPAQLVPEVRIWDFEQETWQPIGSPVWGKNNVADFAPYIGASNEVRLRLQDNSSQYGLEIGEIYPILTGNLNE